MPSFEILDCGFQLVSINALPSNVIPKVGMFSRQIFTTSFVLPWSLSLFDVLSRDRNFRKRVRHLKILYLCLFVRLLLENLSTRREAIPYPRLQLFSISHRYSKRNTLSRLHVFFPFIFLFKLRTVLSLPLLFRREHPLGSHPSPSCSPRLGSLIVVTWLTVVVGGN